MSANQSTRQLVVFSPREEDSALPVERLPGVGGVPQHDRAKEAPAG